MEIASYFDSLVEFEKEGSSLSSQIVNYHDGLDFKDFDLALLYVPENRWLLESMSSPVEIFTEINNPWVIYMCMVSKLEYLALGFLSWETK